MSAIDNFKTREGRVLAEAAYRLLVAAQAFEDADLAERVTPADE